MPSGVTKKVITYASGRSSYKATPNAIYEDIIFIIKLPLINC
jgi:hypothetical protein